MTPYPDVNQVLDLVRSEVHAVLGGELTGLYLWGSLATGDFDPATSDIDFVAASRAELTKEVVRELSAAYGRITATGLYWANRLEGDFIPEQSLRRHNPADRERPRMDFEDGFVLQRQDERGVIMRHILREWGVTLSGPSPKTLIDPVSPENLREAVLALLAGKWSARLRHPTLLANPDYQAYAILTMCRMLYTLREGTITSKPTAARWSMDTLGSPWPALIERALARRGLGSDLLDQARAFVRFTLTEAGIQQIGVR